MAQLTIKDIEELEQKAEREQDSDGFFVTAGKLQELCRLAKFTLKRWEAEEGMGEFD